MTDYIKIDNMIAQVSDCCNLAECSIKSDMRDRYSNDRLRDELLRMHGWYKYLVAVREKSKTRIHEDSITPKEVRQQCIVYVAHCREIMKTHEVV